MKTYPLHIDLNEPALLSSDMTFVSGDVGAYTLSVTFSEGGKPLDISPYYFSVKARRADGCTLSQGGNIVDGKAVIALNNDIYQVPGELCLELALSDSLGKYITTKIVLATVLEGIGETDETKGNTSSVYVTLLSEINNRLERATTILNSVGDIETALDTILSIQKKLIGGSAK